MKPLLHALLLPLLLSASAPQDPPAEAPCPTSCQASPGCHGIPVGVFLIVSGDSATDGTGTWNCTTCTKCHFDATAVLPSTGFFTVRQDGRGTIQGSGICVEIELQSGCNDPTPGKVEILDELTGAGGSIVLDCGCTPV